jgi:uncharacterized protein YqeY
MVSPIRLEESNSWSLWMNIKEQLNQALKDALRKKDNTRKSTIRLALAAIKNAEIDANAELDEAALLAILQKEVKSRRETIEAAERAQRQDLIQGAHAEIAILEEYLPQPLTSAELEDLVRAAIAETGATTPRDMGTVMKHLMSQVQGRADGKTVSQVVRQFLVD